MSQNWFTYKDATGLSSVGKFKEYTVIEDFPENCIGFVYKVTNIKTGKFYIGKKSLYSSTHKKLTKKEIAEHTGPGKKPTKKLVVRESDWLRYWGSNKVLLGEVKEQGVDTFRREILKFCFNKKQLTYWEVYFQCINEVLLTDKSYNDNVLAKFFRKDLVISE
jgi:hypothetical protein